MGNSSEWRYESGNKNSLEKYLLSFEVSWKDEEIIKKLRQKNKITLLTSYSNDVPSIFFFLSSKAHQSKNEKKKVNLLTIGKMILNLP